MTSTTTDARIEAAQDVIVAAGYGCPDRATMKAALAAADRVSAGKVEGWRTVLSAMPAPHAKYQVKRNGSVHTATPCYGMHAPWWVPTSITGAECEPVTMLDTDEWQPIPDPPPASAGG